MPPAISDDESSDVDAHLPVASWREDDDGEARPARRTAAATKPTSVDLDDDEDQEDEEKEQSGEAKTSDAENGNDDDDDDDEEGDEDVFIVEAIKKHMIDEDGSLKFHVKWEGYDKKADMTWEPEENLEESANEILEEYFNKIGGRDSIFKETAKALSGKKRGRKGSSAVAGGVSADPTPTKRSRKSNGTHPSQSTPPASTKPWSPPAGSWEEAIQSIDACHDEGSGNLMVYLVWKNGKKTKHTTQVIYAKCPQKMLQFYEQHIKIVKPEEES
ncbi:chromo domain-containing protein [Cordyceps fumosorosea ARSEF 2679]|uniref:Chromo domain-containing protein n=1 Tax=Cordyceps fumosorosea (strain ARSEF 2679) TaxID=1081104 RepID=A0A162JKD2_CORFA|nr:chromo domain-containing protein [Cordyceps fumosorosea ARSEF 2679]OAA70262.1 chromo domain-containing protein [Cordyceps fumosorosea ARSEF 2679]